MGGEAVPAQPPARGPMQTFDLPGERIVPDAMQFSPDGRLLAVQAMGRVDVLDTTTGAVWPVCQNPNAKAGTAGVGFTADGRQVVFFQYSGGGVHAFNLETKLN